MKWTALNSSDAEKTYRDFLVVYAKRKLGKGKELIDLPFSFHKNIEARNHKFLYTEYDYYNPSAPYKVRPAPEYWPLRTMTVSHNKFYKKNAKTVFLYDGLYPANKQRTINFFSMENGTTSLLKKGRQLPIDQRAIKMIAAAGIDVTALQKKYDNDIHDQNQIQKIEDMSPPIPMELEGHYVDFLEGYIRKVEKRGFNLKKRPFEKVESLKNFSYGMDDARIIQKNFDLNLNHPTLQARSLWFVALPGNKITGKENRPVFNMNDFSFHGTENIPVSTRMLASLHKRGLNIEPIKERLNISRHEFEQALVETGQNQIVHERTDQLIEQVETLKTIVETLQKQVKDKDQTENKKAPSTPPWHGGPRP